jgi:DNA polymerase I-like protein with 3'-5' exonuclease and polymerase domains
MGLAINGGLRDVQIAEPLLDENKGSYKLNVLAKDYVGQEKKTDWLEAKYSGRFKAGVIKHLHEIPLADVAAYGKEDARLTYLVHEQQLLRISAEDLTDIYDLELRLIPVLLKMRKQGVRVDTALLGRLGLELADLSYDLQKELNAIAGHSINVNSSVQLEQLFIAQGLNVTYNTPTDNMLSRGTTRGSPKFDKDTLTRYGNTLAQKILEIRHIKTLLSLYLIPYPDLLISDRMHCNFNQLRSDNYGTVSGRMSASNPNLQQVAAKDEEFAISEILNGKVIRRLFVPEDGCEWAKLDWSQIEYRIIAHYATGVGAETIRKRYNEDKTVDYHAEMSRMTGLEDRSIVKRFNFGGAYGQGIASMARKNNWPLEEAELKYHNYHKKVPFLRETARRVAQKARVTGFIRTLLGRRARLVDRRKDYVMFNRLIQGGAADLMKKAMVDAYEAGLFNTLKPHLTVHDELDVSVPRSKEGKEAIKELQNLMETCVKIRVPILAELETGPNWGEVKKVT